ncbi:hypothetical protein Tco_1119926, partial [Tanacetum coccineum]
MWRVTGDEVERVVVSWLLFDERHAWLTKGELRRCTKVAPIALDQDNLDKNARFCVDIIYFCNVIQYLYLNGHYNTRSLEIVVYTLKTRVSNFKLENNDVYLYYQILKLGDEDVGGGLSVTGSSWDKEALAIAHQVFLSFDGVG